MSKAFMFLCLVTFVATFEIPKSHRVQDRLLLERTFREHYQEIGVERTCKEDEIMKPNPLHDANTFKAQNQTSKGVKVNASELTFCQMVNYTALLPADPSWTPQAADKKAKEFYDAAQKVLDRFDCRDFYPYKQCDYCRAAYKEWLCGIMFPMKCKESSNARKLCKDVCYTVVRKCPVELEFHCPTDDQAYTHPTKTNDVPDNNCNAMSYWRASARGRTAGASLALLSLSAWAFVMFLSSNGL
eukprot:NODE_292_length_1524_cov_207.738305_g199_i1.p1 GENE.NODE_292_length_1524_cov_207.738305_g199_i1~~NODE_292_length_1524_cov_207.738305_g199_i1.p1  ORF type:complete len:267 (+),score=34.90 NODE_292_length_1524_cov_207.738305_g199_i1:73-801(+)